MADHPFQPYQTVYLALELAAALFDLRSKYHTGFNFSTAKEMFTAYSHELYQFDQIYRKINELAIKSSWLAGIS